MEPAPANTHSGIQWRAKEHEIWLLRAAEADNLSPDAFATAAVGKLGIVVLKCVQVGDGESTKPLHNIAAIGSLMVSPSHQKKGYGSQLVAEAERFVNKVRI